MPARLPSTGRILVLENDRVLEGEIERVGDQYRIRRSGGEMWVPVSQTRWLCGDLEQAYLFLKKQSNADDPDEHLRLARWCHLQNLRPQALAEATEAVRLRPRHAESVQMLRSLERSAHHVPVVGAPRQVQAEADPPENLPINADALGLFVSQVQPILMNTCASCHSTGRSGSFKLTRAGGGLLNGRKATQRNLVAVLGELDRTRPQDSRFLHKALSIHGSSGKPPLPNRESPAYQALEKWVLLATAGPSQNKPKDEAGDQAGKPDAPVGTTPPAIIPMEPVQAKPATPPDKGKQGQKKSAGQANQGSPPHAKPGTPPAVPFAATASPQAPKDEFDPNIFNQQMNK